MSLPLFPFELEAKLCCCRLIELYCWYWAVAEYKLENSTTFLIFKMPLAITYPPLPASVITMYCVQKSICDSHLTRSATCEATRIYQFVTNNHASFYLWWKENLLNRQKVLKYYQHDCRTFNQILLHLLLGYLLLLWEIVTM